MLSLSEISVGECAAVERILATGNDRRRLLDLGFAEGARVKCLGKSPLGDPTAYLVRGCTVALRKEDSEKIEVRGDDGEQSFK